MKSLIKKTLVLGVVLSMAVTGQQCLTAEEKTQKPPPNFILIMADDLGYGDIGCYGNEKIKTPVLDQMAAEGIRFTNYYSNGAVCTPTRASLMTGNYAQRAGLEGVIYAQMARRYAGGLSSDEKTIGELFQEQGYTTGIFGKWHLGYELKHNPVNHGFDEFYGYVSGNVDYISHRDGIGLYDWWHNTDSIYEEGYVTDLITNHALEFMEQNQGNPFFLYLPHEAPHFPFQGRNDEAERLPGQEFVAHGSRPDKDVAYQEMIEVMDENIGRVFQKLEELELDDNTLVLFCSDNGPLEVGSSGNLHGYKTSLWEGGIRVPAIAWYPSGIKEGTVSVSHVVSMDIMPTLLSIAGIDTELKFDGTDFSQVLFKNHEIKDRVLFWRFNNQWAVREGDWKYLRIKDEEYLFNLRTDESENRNLIKKHTEKVDKLRSLLDDWEGEMEKYNQQTK